MPQNKLYSSPAERQKAYRERMRQQREAELAAKNLQGQLSFPRVPGATEWQDYTKLAILCLKTTRDSMQSYADTRTEKWKQSVKGEQFYHRIGELEQAIFLLENW